MEETILAKTIKAQKILKDAESINYSASKVNKLLESKSREKSITFLLNRILGYWGYPEFEILDKKEGRKRLEKAAQTGIKKCLMEQKVDPEKVEAAQTMRRNKNEQANRNVTINAYLYKYAQGEMRFATLDEIKNKYPKATAYSFEHLLRAHKGKFAIDMPISFAYVEDIQKAINNSGAKEKVSLKQAESFAKSFCVGDIEVEYRPIYRNIEKAPEMKKLTKKYNKNKERIQNNTYSDKIKEKKLALLKNEFSEKRNNLISENENAKKDMIKVMDFYIKNNNIKEKTKENIISHKKILAEN